MGSMNLVQDTDCGCRGGQKTGPWGPPLHWRVSLLRSKRLLLLLAASTERPLMRGTKPGSWAMGVKSAGAAMVVVGVVVTVVVSVSVSVSVTMFVVVVYEVPFV
jgi:hypothetical protein